MPTSTADPEIDDPEDLQDTQLRALLRKSPDFRIGQTEYVIGSGILPPRWQSLQRTVSSATEALDILNEAVRKGLDNAELALLSSKLPNKPPVSDRQANLKAIADAIAGRQLYIIRKRASPPKGRADPSVFQKVNGTYNTRVDFGFLAEWEGGQYLHGYVPFAQGVVAGNSGVTIATGFDIGQKSVAAIGKLSVSDELIAELKPFATVTFKNMNRQQVIDRIKGLNAPIPVITKAEADQLDIIIHAEHLAAAVAAFDGSRMFGVPSFRELPVNWQTVIFSRFYHQGVGAHRTGVAQAFWKALTTGRWEDAANALENYPVSQPWYKSRVGKEAKHLRTQLPPPMPKQPGLALPPSPRSTPGATPPRTIIG